MNNIQKLEKFYSSKRGEVFSWFLHQEIKKIWNLDNSEKIIGLGTTQFLHIPNCVNFSLSESKKSVVTSPIKLPLRNSDTRRVCALHYLENLHTPFLAIEEIARILEPAGSFILIVPNTNSLWKKTEIMGDYNWRKQEIREMLLANKLHIQQVKQAVFYPPEISSEATKLFSLIPFFGAVTIYHARKIVFPNRGKGIKLSQNIREWVLSKKKTVNISANSINNAHEACEKK